MKQNETRNGSNRLLASPASELRVSRRTFVRALGATSMLTMFGSLESFASAGAYFTVVNHFHQCGVGWFFREGVVGKKHYRRAFSIFYGIQESIEAIRKHPGLAICLELDSHAYEAIQDEDPEFVEKLLNPLILNGRIDIVGGTYSQPYSQLIGWQSNVRQFVEGRRTAREVLHKDIDVFIAEELNFHPQMPQLLKLCGFKYASMQVENNGGLPAIKKAIIDWRGLDASIIRAIPPNPWMITSDKQYQSLAAYLDVSAKEQEALLTIWSEIWPPGVDWGSSFAPYDEGFKSLELEGAEPLSLSEYMNLRWKQGTPADSRYFKLDEAKNAFGWPQNKGSLWETIGGWGYEGDALLKENRRVEHELHAAELLLSILPDARRSARMDRLWKKLMKTQNHDCFIVAGFPGEYNHVVTTNLGITKTIIAEIDCEVRELRKTILDDMSKAANSETHTEVVCQNAACIPVRQPVTIEMDSGKGGYALSCGDERIELQRIDPPYSNSKIRWIAIVNLPPCGIRTYNLTRIGARNSKPVSGAKGISNEYYSISWDEARKAFSLLDRDEHRSILFRPFSGEITHVKETLWASPNVNAKFRARTFGEVPFSSQIESEGPVYHAMSVRGDFLTQYTTDEPAAWVTARAILYSGLKRVDILTELHTYPRMSFLAFAELEIAPDKVVASRDFPFGEEETHNEQFSALSYVRLQSEGFVTLLAHGGTQQFFLEQKDGITLLRNMIARETMKGAYRWQWSIATGSSFTPSQSYRFAEEFRGPVVQQHAGHFAQLQSWLSVSDPALVIFRLCADSEKITVWLVNYSDTSRTFELKLMTRVRSCRCVDFEGQPANRQEATLHGDGREIRIGFAPWQMTALEILRA